jgi:hypothetical protein
MSKQKRPDTYEEEISEIPKPKSKKVKSPPKKKKNPPKSYICPFCKTKFTLKRRRKISFPFRSYYNYDSAEYWVCKKCGAKPWGYKELLEEDKKFPWRNMYIWRAESCTFCNASGYDCGSKEHYFVLWRSKKDDIYCDKCKFRGKIGGGIER